MMTGTSMRDSSDGLQGLVAPRDVGRVDDGRPVTVDESGRRDADGGDVVRAAEVAGHVDDGVSEGPGVDRGVDPQLLDDVPFVVDDAARDLRPADVDTDLEHRCSSPTGARATAPCSLAARAVAHPPVATPPARIDSGQV